MTLKPVKIAISLLLGVWMAAYSVVAVSPEVPAGNSRVSAACCHDCQHCGTPACCAAQNAPSAPAAPASLPSASQNEFQALAASVVLLYELPTLPVCERSPGFFPPVSMTAVPLFQRDCCYLI